MAHLRKHADSGHLLKSLGSQHLVIKCWECPGHPPLPDEYSVAWSGSCLQYECWHDDPYFPYGLKCDLGASPLVVTHEALDCYWTGTRDNDPADYVWARIELEEIDWNHHRWWCTIGGIGMYNQERIVFKGYRDGGNTPAGSYTFSSNECDVPGHLCTEPIANVLIS